MSAYGIFPIRIKFAVPGVYDDVPTQAHPNEWFDLRSAEDVTMLKGDFRMISLGVCMELLPGYEAIVAPRSSTFKNFGIMLTNGIGIIDSEYCGDNDIWHFPAIAVRNTIIHKGDRICQFRVIRQQPLVEFDVVEHLGNADRNGLGSTGTR